MGRELELMVRKIYPMALNAWKATPDIKNAKDHLNREARIALQRISER